MDPGKQGAKLLLEIDVDILCTCNGKPLTTSLKEEISNSRLLAHLISEMQKPVSVIIWNLAALSENKQTLPRDKNIYIQNMNTKIEKSIVTIWLLDLSIGSP